MVHTPPEPARDRLPRVRAWLLTLPEKVSRWIRSQPPVNDLAPRNAPLTEGYAGLLLAFGSARLGEERQAQALQRAALAALEGGDQVAQVLTEAYCYRVAQALDGKPPTGPLPELLMARVAEWDRQDRYLFDRTRERSRVLVPHQHIDPYLGFKTRFFDRVGTRLAALEEATDRVAIEQGIAALLSQTRGDSKDDGAARAQVVKAGLGLAPRVGEEFALLLLAEAPAAYRSIEDPLHAAEFLNTALFAAAHFDQKPLVREMAALFRGLIERLHTGPAALGQLDSLAAQCFRGLRRLGLREELHGLLRQTAAVVTDGKSYADLRGGSEWHNQVRALLRVAAGWYYLGREDEARPVVEEARQLLYQGSLMSVNRTKLAAAYVETLGQVPVDLAMQCIDELFAKLSGVNDMFATATYFSQSQLIVIESVVLAALELAGVGDRTG